MVKKNCPFSKDSIAFSIYTHSYIESWEKPLRCHLAHLDSYYTDSYHSISSIAKLIMMSESIPRALYDILLLYTERDEIIDDILFYIEVDLLLWKYKIFSRKICKKITLYFIGVPPNMRSDIDSYIFSRRSKSLDSSMSNMNLRPTPSAMEACTFTLSHEDDHWAVSADRCYDDTRWSRIYSVTFRKRNISILLIDLMDILLMHLTYRTENLRGDRSLPKVAITSWRDENLKSWKCTKYFHSDYRVYSTYCPIWVSHDDMIFATSISSYSSTSGAANSGRTMILFSRNSMIYPYCFFQIRASFFSV